MLVTRVGAVTTVAALSLLAPASAYAADAPSPQSSGAPASRHLVDPQVSFSKDCRDGITVILSNIAPDDSTTDAVTFHVTAPTGRTSDVLVQPNQLVKVIYAVREGATATVGVDTPGLAHQAFSWTKHCTRVLGEKVTRTPAKAPQDPPAAAPELPFTGLPTVPLTALGVALIAVGALLQRGVRRRTP